MDWKFVRESSRRGATGFSLVEVLVATTILLVVVIMTSMVFQQANGAFASGTRRVKTQSVMRILSGAIMHDLSFLVDSDRFEGVNGNSFSPKRIQFIASGGESAVQEREGEEIVFRPYRLITYSYGEGVLTRSEQPLLQSGRGWRLGDKVQVAMNDSKTEPLLDLSFDAVFPEGNDSTTVPLRVDIHMEKETTGKATYVSARSAGPDRDFDTDDDIWAGEPPFTK